MISWKKVYLFSYYLILILVSYGVQDSCKISCNKLCIQLYTVKEIKVPWFRDNCTSTQINSFSAPGKQRQCLLHIAEVQSDAVRLLIRNYFSSRITNLSSVKWSPLSEICMPIWIRMQISLFLLPNSYLLSCDSDLWYLSSKDKRPPRTQY